MDRYVEHGIQLSERVNIGFREDKTREPIGRVSGIPIGRCVKNRIPRGSEVVVAW
jgi:hypothetical protein